MDTENTEKSWFDQNPKPSIYDCEVFFEKLIFDEKLSEEEFNAMVGKLKVACVGQGIDHSRFTYKSNPKKTLNPIAIIDKNTNPVRSSVHKDETVVQTLLKTLDDHLPFLSKVILQISEGESNAETKIAIVFGNTLHEYTTFRNIKHDIVIPLTSFESHLLDAKFAWIILIVFHSSEKGMKEKIKSVVSKYPTSRYLDMHDFINNEDHYWKKDSTRALAHIFSDNPCILIHENINSEYECIIKSFFGNSCSFLIYTSLKGGFSGSKVLLVSPKGVGDQKMFVIKISDKGTDKLKIEKNNYKNFVEPYWTPGQYITADWQETLNLYAIRYPFASTDSIAQSISFSEMYKDKKNYDPQKLKTVIGKVFDHNLQKKWKEKMLSRKASFQKAFEKNLKWEKTKDSLTSLLELNPSVNIQVTDIEKILATEIDYIECVNHGDLHSDNIQVQEESVFLIDFGLTEVYPCGLDFAMLEASIRFKLLDYSIGSPYLKKEHIPELQSFDNHINLEKSFSNESEKAIKSCSVIRQKFLNHFSEHSKGIEFLKHQYYYCLLSICLRQLNYEELNRKYMLLTIEWLIDTLQPAKGKV